MLDILNIELSFEGMERGKTSTISKIKINRGQVPAGTNKLYLILEDMDIFGESHGMPHGMHFIDFENSDIVLNNEFTIMPLTPPPGRSHHYRLTVRAFDNNHDFIGIGTVIQKFP